MVKRQKINKKEIITGKRRRLWEEFLELLQSSGRACWSLFFGVDYHSHLGTRRGGMASLWQTEAALTRAIHNIEKLTVPYNYSTKTCRRDDREHLGIGCISDFEPQPLLDAALNLGSFAITTVGKTNNYGRADRA